MSKDQRTVITNQTIHQELMRKQKGILLGFFIGLALILAMAIPLTIFAFGQSHPLPKVIVVVLDLYFVVGGVLGYIHDFRICYLVVHKRYNVVEDTLRGIAIEERVLRPVEDRLMPRYNSRYRYESALYFDGYGRVATTKRVCDHAIIGDTYYLVVCENKKRPILLFYNTKTHRYETDGTQE